MAGKTIAVVDDEPFIVEMITTFFELKGYTVRGVYTGQEGLVLTQVEQPDVLLLDLMLPDIHGYEVAETLRKDPQFAQLPIVIISARVEPESRQRAEKAGANAYLTKPLKMTEVLAEVEHALANPPAPARPDTAPTTPAESAPAGVAASAQASADDQTPAEESSGADDQPPAEETPPDKATQAQPQEGAKPVDAPPPSPGVPGAHPAAEPEYMPVPPPSTDTTPPDAGDTTPSEARPTDPDTPPDEKPDQKLDRGRE